MFKLVFGYNKNVIYYERRGAADSRRNTVMMKKVFLSAVLVFTIILCASCGGAGYGGAEDEDQSRSGAEQREKSETDGGRESFFETEDNLTAPEDIEDAQAEVTESGTKGLSGTWTGYAPLPAITFDVNDPGNSRGLSTEKRMYSYGVPKDEQPNIQSINNQKFFSSCGYKAFAYDDKTKEKAVYLTFDCGYENGNTYKILDVLEEKSVPAAFFCTIHHIESEPRLIARIILGGNIVGNHSAYHPDFSEIDRERMAREILTVENCLREKFGYSSEFFRFPKGNYSECSLELVDSMGLSSVFWSSAYVDWNADEIKGADYAFKNVTSRLHPGAVILLHSVSADNAAAMGDIIDYARSKGYVFRSLNDYGK